MKQLPGKTLVPMDNEPFSIPTYVINLKRRADRKAHVLAQFEGRNEFSLRIIEAFQNSFGALALWMTIRYIIHDLAPDDAEYVIICEDDIEFTEHYSKEILFDTINDAKKHGADVLLGGVSWSGDTLQISKSLFWTDNFSGLHFTIIFKKFFNILSDTKLKNYDAADYYLARLSDNVLFRHPFLAVQKDFGYSDATFKNNEDGVVRSLFYATNRRLEVLNKVAENCKNSLKEIDEVDYNTISLPTYVINLPERAERLQHITQEFKNKPEFDIQIIEACKHEIGALGLWLSIRKIIELAIANDDDVIVICEDDHQFTGHYTKEYLIKNIINAHEEGADFLSGGTGMFTDAIAITNNRYWVNHCLSTQFVVVYQKFFQVILDFSFDESIVADLAYSRLGLNKMVLHPFISIQKDFGYSDITLSHQQDANLVTNMFIQSNLKFERLKQISLKYSTKQDTSDRIKKYA